MGTVSKYDIFACPDCHAPLDAAMSADEGSVLCPGCGRKYGVYHGCADFVSSGSKSVDERAFYEKVYDGKNRGSGPPLHAEKLEGMWLSSLFRERAKVLERMGHLEGKTVLCIGNGDKEKELYFSWLGARLIISDISLASMLAMRKKYEGGLGDIAFHAIDAYRIPLKGASVDIVYGWQMTHHLEDLPLFLREVKRVLKDGGIAVFVDNAYSPGWHKVKWGLLGPFIRFAHKKKGVSPRDLELSKKGDYKESFLKDTAITAGFRDFSAARENLLLYVYTKALRDVLNVSEITKKNRVLYPIARTLSRWDDILCGKYAGFRDNRRNMVWSIRKG